MLATQVQPGSSSQRRSKLPHVLVIGAGVTGCSSAWLLAREGLQVTVLERSVPGAEASSSAAGILGPQVEAHVPGPLVTLARRSLDLFPGWARALRRETGLDVGFRQGGSLRVSYSPGSVQKCYVASAWQHREGWPVRKLTGAALRRIEPALSSKLKAAVYYERDARVDPRLLSEALHEAARAAGARFVTGVTVRGVEIVGGRVVGVKLESGGKLRAHWVLVAAGSWATKLDGLGLGLEVVRPAHGQIVQLSLPRAVLSRVVFGPTCYLVPRDDGRVLVGSTLEFVGYRKRVTAGAVARLLSAAVKLVPALEEAEVSGLWSNFRPHTADELPLLGRSHLPGLVLAAGHYRNGILLAPATAEAVRAIILGQAPPVDLSAFDPTRYRV